MAQLSLRIVEEANIGLRKKEQQDFHGHLFIPADPEKNILACCLLVVADGVSMGMAGALASKTAVETMLGEFDRFYLQQGFNPVIALENAFLRANYEVFVLSQDRPGMATTMACGLIIGDQLITAHVGDTRIYLQRPVKGLFPVTTDHSWVVEFGEGLVESGQITAESLKTDNRRHTITRALGLEATVLIDINLSNLQNQDLIMLCSDGLWDMVGEERLQTLLTDGLGDIRHSWEPQKFHDLCHEMVEAAMKAGGRDNITLALAMVDELGMRVAIPELERLLERTRQDLDERRNLAPPISEEIYEPTTLSGIPYVPIGLRNSPPPEAVQPEQALEKSPAQIVAQSETILAKGQQLFALGQWEEGLNELFILEKVNASHHGLYEVLSNLLVRYIGGAIASGELVRAGRMHKRLVEENINRYDGVIFDYCMEESRKASNAYNYKLSLDFANFAARLKPQDSRIRTVQELNTLYLELEKPDQSVEQKLSIAQRLYARDASFGAIQDDLAVIYMGLGDGAAQTGNTEDAVAWYELIKPLKPRDARLVSLSNSKLRSLEDRKARQPGGNNSATRGENGNLPIPNGLEKFSASRTAGADGKPEAESVTRLKERVSRAQKAWDNGRKEIGSEYIYLVDQLGQIISPNPWQPTFPRVCYDYAKWLLEQKQYGEARPYFVKAQALGMAAAQQRLSEIDRIEREQQLGRRGALPLDLPTDQPPATYARATYSEPRPPLINPSPTPPSDANFVGTSQGRVDSGNNNGVLPTQPASDGATFTYVPPASPVGYGSVPPAGQADRFAKSERLVGVSGTLRNLGMSDPIQDTASRIAGQPGSAPPPTTPLRRREASSGFMAGLSRYAIPGAIGLVVGLVALLVVANILGNIGKNNTQANSPSASATTVAAVTTTSAAVVSGGAAVNVRLDGPSPDSIQVWLTIVGEKPSSWRELTYDPAGSFQLLGANASKLDPAAKYLVVVRPKDTTTRKFRQDLPLDDSLQTLFSKGDLTFNPSAGLNTNWKIAPEALNFYPLAGGAADANLPDGGRFIAATRHSMRGEFMRTYDTTGGIARYGYPVSEDFDLDTVGRVQFFERGWLVESPGDKLVKLGKLGTDVLSLTTCEAIPKPPASVGTAAPKTNPAFVDYLKLNQSLGQPISPAFEISDGNVKRRLQYFEFARLEVTINGTDNTTGPVNLGLLGSEYARCKGWYW